MSLNKVLINTNQVIGVDEKSTNCSDNLVKSGGVLDFYKKSEYNEILNSCILPINIFKDSIYDNKGDIILN